MKEKLLSIVPKTYHIPLLFALLWNTVAYYGARLVTTGWHHHNIESFADSYIPYLPWTVTIYLGCYVVWVLNYIYVCKQEEDKVWAFFSADFLAKMVCLIIFIVFPTTNTRPIVENNSIFDLLMQLVYRVDEANNLFPSIHCLVSWFCYIAVRRVSSVPKWYRAFSLVFALMVCVSTLTTKQHVIIDTFAGVLLAELCYQISKRTGFFRVYRKCLRKIIPRKKQ